MKIDTYSSHNLGGHEILLPAPLEHDLPWSNDVAHQELIGQQHVIGSMGLGSLRLVDSASLDVEQDENVYREMLNPTNILYLKEKFDTAIAKLETSHTPISIDRRLDKDSSRQEELNKAKAELKHKFISDYLEQGRDKLNNQEVDALVIYDISKLMDMSYEKLEEAETASNKGNNRLADEAAEAQRLADEAQVQADADAAEQARLAEEQRLADEAEAQRLADEAQAQADADAAEQARLAEEQRLADEAEAQRLADEAQAQADADAAEQARLAEEHRLIEKRRKDKKERVAKLEQLAKEAKEAAEAEAERLANELKRSKAERLKGSELVNGTEARNKQITRIANAVNAEARTPINQHRAAIDIYINEVVDEVTDYHTTRGSNPLFSKLSKSESIYLGLEKYLKKDDVKLEVKASLNMSDDEFDDYVKQKINSLRASIEAIEKPAPQPKPVAVDKRPKVTFTKEEIEKIKTESDAVREQLLEIATQDGQDEALKEFLLLIENSANDYYASVVISKSPNYIDTIHGTIAKNGYVKYIETLLSGKPDDEKQSQIEKDFEKIKQVLNSTEQKYTKKGFKEFVSRVAQKLLDARTKLNN